jgi:hypothetical protein
VLEAKLIVKPEAAFLLQLTLTIEAALNIIGVDPTLDQTRAGLKVFRFDNHMPCAVHI